MLFRIENREQRDDMNGLMNIRGPFDEAINALMNGEVERSKTLLNTSLAAAMTSNDLTKADRRRVTQALREEYKEIEDIWRQIQGELVRGVVRGIGETHDINEAMERAMPVEKALELGEPTFEEIFSRS